MKSNLNLSCSASVDFNRHILRTFQVLSTKYQATYQRVEDSTCCDFRGETGALGSFWKRWNEAGLRQGEASSASRESVSYMSQCV